MQKLSWASIHKNHRSGKVLPILCCTIAQYRPIYGLR
jgi:hypothetical protein